MIDDSTDIPTMPATLFRPVSHLGHFRMGIIRGIPVGKTIRHQQINHIGSIKSPPSRRSRLPFMEHIINGRHHSPILRKVDVIGPGWDLQCIHGDKQVVGIFRTDHIFDHKTWNIHIIPGQILSIKHNLQLGALHPTPPKLRFYPLYLSFKRICAQRKGQPNGQ